MADSMWIIPFGKHEGMPVEELPHSYLMWLTEQDWFYEQFAEECEIVAKELAYRDRFGGRGEFEDDWSLRFRK